MQRERRKIAGKVTHATILVDEGLTLDWLICKGYTRRAAAKLLSTGEAQSVRK